MDEKFNAKTRRREGRKGREGKDENALSREIIGAAIEVHREVGPGLVESVYEEALCHELHLRGLGFVRQQRVPLTYKGLKLVTGLRLDLLVEGKVIVELKAKEHLSPVGRPALLTYLRLLKLRLGMLINFHSVLLRDGIYRVVNGLPGKEENDLEPPNLRA